MTVGVPWLRAAWRAISRAREVFPILGLAAKIIKYGNISEEEDVEHNQILN